MLARGPRAYPPELSAVGPYTMCKSVSVHRLAEGSTRGPFCAILPGHS